VQSKIQSGFHNKLKIVKEEADESQFFLEFILEVQPDNGLTAEIQRLIKEADEILSIVVASIKTSRGY
jgi:hypothetical protein